MENVSLCFDGFDLEDNDLPEHIYVESLSSITV